jgi:sialic acid synthase SpsE
VAVRALPAGHTLTATDLVPKRPANGLPVRDLEWVVGHKLARPLAEDDFLTLDHLLGER